ncbi:MAG: class I SAM-dependent methyltransferase [Nocardiopsaceae bacterium]|nr:class I SAM-dependent methyltransferase [Nocardiopsaceae bacterium]
MNIIHRWLCRSPKWARFAEQTLVPGLDGIALGADVLEIGSGYGVTARPLASRCEHLTALEIDPELASGLRDRLADLGERVTVVHGDGTRLPFPPERFSAVVCFTMLHHVPSTALQDRLFAEAHRVLRPGGVFAGSDSLPSPRFRAIHLFDTCVPVAPETLPGRLASAGFTGVAVQSESRLHFRALKPAPADLRA